MKKQKLSKKVIKLIYKFYSTYIKSIFLQAQIEKAYSKSKNIQDAEVLRLNNELSKSTVLLNDYKKTLTEVKV